MKFWRAEFGPKCAGDAFDKKYAYGVRYNYAKEGKRTDYTPYSCMKIIQTPVPKVKPQRPSCHKQAEQIIQPGTMLALFSNACTQWQCCAAAAIRLHSCLLPAIACSMTPHSIPSPFSLLHGDCCRSGLATLADQCQAASWCPHAGRGVWVPLQDAEPARADRDAARHARGAAHCRGGGGEGEGAPLPAGVHHCVPGAAQLHLRVRHQPPQPGAPDDPLLRQQHA